MKIKDKKALSWTVSLLVHATGFALIIWASFHLAVPEGDVSDKTSFEVVGGDKPETAPPPPPAPVTTPEVENPPLPQKAVQAAPVADDESTDEKTKSVDVAPPAVTEADKSAPPLPAKVATPSDSDSESADSVSDADAADDSSDAPPTPVAAVPAASLPPGPGGSVPAFGTPGTTLDESKLTEVSGNHKPNYPWMARLRRQQGTVTLHAYVQADGGVTQVTIEKSSGWPLIDEECQKSYARWRYKSGPSGWVVKDFIFSLK